MEDIKVIKRYIANGQLDKAVQLLYTCFASDPELEEEVLLLAYRLKMVNNGVQSLQLKWEEAYQYKTAIAQSLLMTLKRIEHTETRKSQAKPKESPQPL